MPIRIRFTALWRSVGIGTILWLLAGCASGPPGGSPRDLYLLHPESRESARGVYWRDGSYVQPVLNEFNVLFRDRRSNDVQAIDPALFDYLYELRDAVGVGRETPIHLLSGYRSKNSNTQLAKTNGNVAENSYHIRAKAADIRIPGIAPQRLADAAASLNRGGYACYGENGHVHVDTGPMRTWKPRLYAARRP